MVKCSYYEFFGIHVGTVHDTEYACSVANFCRNLIVYLKQVTCVTCENVRIEFHYPCLQESSNRHIRRGKLVLFSSAYTVLYLLFSTCARDSIHYRYFLRRNNMS